MRTDSKMMTKTTTPNVFGYRLIGTFGELFRTGLPKIDVLHDCGVYKVIAPWTYTPDFKSESDVIASNNVLRPWTNSRLQEKWVHNTNIIYIGLAGAKSARSLRKRLSDLLCHGRGKTSDRGPHKGGEILWQLVGYDEFEIWVQPTGLPPEPRDEEMRLLQSFYDEHGSLPFANRQF